MAEQDYIPRLKGKVEKSMLQSVSGTSPLAGRMPVDSEVTDREEWVKGLIEDGERFWMDYWSRTSHMRPTYLGNTGKSSGGAYHSPQTFRMAQDLLEAENDWQVWGRRNGARQKNAWKSEEVDGELGRKMRARKAHINGVWHDIKITPNIANFRDIYDQEREKMGWGDWIGDYISTAMKRGDSTNRIFIDYTENEGGQIKHRVCAPGSVFRTPWSLSYKRADGCWYAIEGIMVTGQDLEESYPGIDLSELTTSETLTTHGKSTAQQTQGRSSDYRSTSFFAKFECFLDDPKVEDVPFGEKEQTELAEEFQKLAEGEMVKAVESQNHLQHIARKLEALENLIEGVTGAPIELEIEQVLSAALSTAKEYDVYASVYELFQKVGAPPEAVLAMNAFLENIIEHAKFVKKSSLASMGKRKAYPFGRYICVAGGKILHDIANPYGVPWRMLFRDLSNEKVSGRIDGRGDPEIMWNRIKGLDTQRSRFMDATLVAAFPKLYRHVSDKAKGVQDGDTETTNDPTEVSYYVEKEPHWVQTSAPKELLELYTLDKGNADEDLAVNDTTIGAEPGSDASGRMVQLLQRQNMIMVTGELDKNLREALKDIVEGDIELMKVLYTQPRQYTIGTEQKEIVVSDLLSFQEVDGRKQQIKKFEIVVKPFSNYPNRWEQDIAFLVEMYTTLQMPDGTPAIPIEAIYDVLSQEYPDFSANGKYRKLNQLVELGKQKVAEIQAEQQAVQGAREDVEGVVRAKEKQQMRSQLDMAVDRTVSRMKGNGNGKQG